jgi:hypothetical protein
LSDERPHISTGPLPPPADLGPAFNWHPLVHAEHFGETLQFILIKLKEPLHKPVREQIRNLLAAANIEYACEYSLFGSWDGLVRAWLGPASYRRLRRVLDDPVSSYNVDDFNGFTATHLHYLRLGETNDLLEARDALGAITSNAKHIDFIASNPDKIDSESWRRLQAAGLVWLKPSDRDGSVKFYTALARTRDHLSTEEELLAITDAMRTTQIPTSGESMLDRATLYRGSGSMGSYLVRCVADTYGDVLSLAEAFDTHLDGTHLRPTTHLIANSKPRESDNANDRLHLTLDETKAAELLGFDDPGTIANLSDAHRRELLRLVSSACEISDTDEKLQKRLLRMLRSSLINDHHELEETLIFLHRFEPYFNRLVEAELEFVFDASWRTRLINKCDLSEDKQWKEHADAMRERKWTIGTWLNTALAACEFDPAFQGRMEGRLGPDWEKRCRALLDLRNEYSHGAVTEIGRLDYYDRNVTKFLGMAIGAAALWRRCERNLAGSDVEMGAKVDGDTGTVL